MGRVLLAFGLFRASYLLRFVNLQVKTALTALLTSCVPSGNVLALKANGKLLSTRGTPGKGGT